MDERVVTGSELQLTRYTMYQRIRRALHERISGKVLGISGIEKVGFLIDSRTADLTKADYPEVDMQDLPYGDCMYDAVIADQVIEHLESPEKAASECWRVTRPGGVVIITSCFLNPIHPSPRDYWRFSPEGLAELFSGPRWEVLECGGWGNRAALILLLIRDSFRFLNVGDVNPVLRWLANWNERKYPIVTWIVCRKL